MNSHVGTSLKVKDQPEYSFLEAVNFEGKNSSVQPHQPLSLSIFPPPSKTKAVVLSQPIASTTTMMSNPSNTSSKTNPAPKMASSKAQAQCLELCHKTTSQIDRLSIRILEYLTAHKQPQVGFETLAHDFIDICQILFSMEAGLTQCGRTGQKFPLEMITELDMKFRVTQADFHILEEMMNKMLGNSGRIRRSLGKMFAATDIMKMTSAMAKTRQSLKMSLLMFRWSSETEKIEKEVRIGYTGLAAALDRMDHRAGVNGHGPLPPTPPASQARTFQLEATVPTEETHNQNSASSAHNNETIHQQLLHHQYQQIPLQQIYSSVPAVWRDRNSPSQTDTYSLGNISRSPNNDQGLLHDYRRNREAVALPITYGSNIYDFSARRESYDHATYIDDGRSISARTESEMHCEDMEALNQGHFKKIRLSVDPSSMPHAHPRNPVDSESANMNAALVSAVRNKNHKIVDQLLNRGVSPNTGASMHALKEAILVHDVEALRLLLMYGADPNDPDRDGNTPLAIAVQQLFREGATMLLKYGADPNLVAGPDLESPLAMVVIANNVGFSHLLLSYNGDIKHMTAAGNTLLIGAIKKKTPKKFVDLLLEYGSDPNSKSRKGETALFGALQVGRADIVTGLLEQGADPNLPGPKHMLWPSVHYPACLKILLKHGADHKKAPGLMELSVSTNNMESVAILLKAGVNPNTKKDGVYTPLCTAIRDDRADFVHLLLSSGADPNLMASEYPAFKCVTHNRVHFLSTLVEAGADLHKPKGILEIAVSSKNLEAINWLLDQGVRPNDKSPKGMSPLTTAIREDWIDMVDILLLRGADPHMRGQDWPLCMAVRNPPILKRILQVVSTPQAFKGVVEMAVHANQLESVKLLLAAGVSVEDKNGGVFSPLTTALRENRRNIVRYLLTDGGADVNAPGEHLPIVKALRRFHGSDTEMLEYLLERGADANKIYRGWNAMMQAVENGDVDVLKLLCQKAGVDLEAKDEMGFTVVDLATARGWDEAVQILKGGDVLLRR